MGPYILAAGTPGHSDPAVGRGTEGFMLFRSRKHSIAVLALVGCLLLPALPAEAAGYRLVPTSLDWQSLWGQFLSWFSLAEEEPVPEIPGDQQVSHAVGKEDAGPYIDPDGKPRLNGTSGQSTTSSAIDPVGSR